MGIYPAPCTPITTISMAVYNDNNMNVLTAIKAELLSRGCVSRETGLLLAQVGELPSWRNRTSRFGFSRRTKLTSLLTSVEAGMVGVMFDPETGLVWADGALDGDHQPPPQHDDRGPPPRPGRSARGRGVHVKKVEPAPLKGGEARPLAVEEGGSPKCQAGKGVGLPRCPRCRSHHSRPACVGTGRWRRTLNTGFLHPRDSCGPGSPRGSSGPGAPSSIPHPGAPAPEHSDYAPCGACGRSGGARTHAASPDGRPLPRGGRGRHWSLSDRARDLARFVRDAARGARRHHGVDRGNHCGRTGGCMGDVASPDP